MVYCMTETNLWPPRSEMWECSTYKGTAAVLPRCSSAICPSVVRRCRTAVLAFLTDIIEASECLKNWWDRGLIEQLDDGTEV